jgi:hypothetical protein
MTSSSPDPDDAGAASDAGAAVRRALPRYRRAGDEAPGFVLQDRDLALLEDVWRYRLLTTSQLEMLRSGDEVAGRRFVSRLPLTRRLKLLFHGGYLRRIARPLEKGSLEPVYVLDAEGARVLRRRHGEVSVRAPSQLPKPAALEHLLAVNQFRASLQVGCAQSALARSVSAPSEGVQLPHAQFLQWRTADEVKFSVLVPGRGEHARRVTLIPDGFCTVRAMGQQLFYYVEVDRGSEPGKTLADKCAAYYAYWKSGGFAHDLSVPTQVGFRVLFSAPSAKRAQTILDAIAKLEAGRTMFWVTLEGNLSPARILGMVFQDDATHEQRGLAGGQTSAGTASAGQMS